MEIQLQELIEQIKREGFETAEAQAKAQLDAAGLEAERIVAEAQAKADEMMRKAKEESDKFTRAAEEAIRQAGRNLLISFRAGVAKELSAVLDEQVALLCTSDKMAEYIIRVVETLAKNEGCQEMTLLLNSEDMASLEKALLARLKEKLLTGVTLQAEDCFAGGFRVGIREGGAYYDFSRESVCEMLATYLNPRVAALLKEADV